MGTRQAQLDQIKADIVANNVNRDLAKQANNMVFGEGNPNAKIIFIGEAPGKNEDLTGRPFVGAAGKFLDELLTSIGLKREDVYITSILKYRPPKNRDPKPEEKAEFWPYLQAQLQVIRPQLIVTLGRHSTNCFLPKAIIGAVHGKPQVWEEYTLLPLYHPAAVLYNGSQRQIIIDDFAVIPTLTRK
ncbi:MAG TPA: uracil-DNA glycosylase [Candidatus Saccharimonadales bacterium]|nr:uracil-DNA glycosylase [Candidatus Saccharimonadales bacterium]